MNLLRIWRLLILVWLAFMAGWWLCERLGGVR